VFGILPKGHIPLNPLHRSINNIYIGSLWGVMGFSMGFCAMDLYKGVQKVYKTGIRGGFSHSGVMKPSNVQNLAFQALGTMKSKEEKYSLRKIYKGKLTLMPLLGSN
jgi:hypothetical protein